MDRDVPSIVLQFYDSNDVKAFSYDKIFNKTGAKTKGEDFGNQWLHKTIYFTSDPLPSKLRLAEITDHEIVSFLIIFLKMFSTTIECELEQEETEKEGDRETERERKRERGRYVTRKRVNTAH